MDTPEGVAEFIGLRTRKAQVVMKAPLAAQFEDCASANARGEMPETFDIVGSRYLSLIPHPRPLAEESVKTTKLHLADQGGGSQDAVDILLGLGDGHSGRGAEEYLVEADKILDDLSRIGPTLLDPHDDDDDDDDDDDNAGTVPNLDEKRSSAEDRDYCQTAFPSAPAFLIGRLVAANRQRRQRRQHQNTYHPRSRAEAMESRRGGVSSATADSELGLQPPGPPVDVNTVENLPFPCQYCGFDVPLELDKRTVDRQDWVSHVYFDLQPYSCTFYGCAQAYKMYGTKE
ncbi:hypothetical protein B0H67DRAFT_640529 [Lasiosphaeris hirsuta]|uniref:Uncharacterized protein n=1 Tax=Lasiosphaeris hirsuta TaxID=260670 RepID=A0AA40BDI1_9PEZI|nr:hypothetical protein B0H67DRAFT_640529 [Lasiosphaeris hirsuta]